MDGQEDRGVGEGLEGRLFLFFGFFFYGKSRALSIENLWERRKNSTGFRGRKECRAARTNEYFAECSDRAEAEECVSIT
jgi:hypothetical protein